MSHTFVQNNLHVVFSTKERRKLISKDLQPKLWSVMAGICRKERIVVLAIGGTDDHVHLFLHLPATMTIAEALRLIKSNSSGWMRETNKKFSWQEGYAALSVSASQRKTVINYIRNQEKHHRKMSFETEFLALLEKHGIEYDPEYVFG